MYIDLFISLQWFLLSHQIESGREDARMRMNLPSLNSTILSFAPQSSHEDAFILMVFQGIWGKNKETLCITTIEFLAFTRASG